MSNKNTANANTTNKKVFNRIIHKGHGDVNLANYLEPEGLTPTVNNDTESEDNKILIPLPYQEKSFSNSDSEDSVKSNNSTWSTTSKKLTSTNENSAPNKTDANNDMSPQENEDKMSEGNNRKATTPEKELHNPKKIAATPKASGKTTNTSNSYVSESHISLMPQLLPPFQKLFRTQRLKLHPKLH
jgi:cobalamin biosynthesis protein CobT